MSLALLIYFSLRQQLNSRGTIGGPILVEDIIHVEGNPKAISTQFKTKWFRG